MCLCGSLVLKKIGAVIPSQQGEVGYRAYRHVKVLVLVWRYHPVHICEGRLPITHYPLPKLQLDYEYVLVSLLCNIAR